MYYFITCVHFGISLLFSKENLNRNSFKTKTRSYFIFQKVAVRIFDVLWESLVVPSIGATIALSRPSRTFIKEDLPTFGRPMIENLGIFCFSSPSDDVFGIRETTLSNNSPVP